MKWQLEWNKYENRIFVGEILYGIENDDWYLDESI
jgi:hypothetical protein